MKNIEHKASVLFGEKEYKQALELYTILLKNRPSTEKYAISCGNCCDALNKKEEAIQYYNKALKINNKSESALLNLSTIYYETKQYKKSEDLAYKVLQINSDNTSALLNLANSYFCNENYEKSLHYYQKIYNNNNNSYIATINLANTYYCIGKYVLALEFAKKSINKHPSSITAHILAGNSLNALEKHEKALEMYLNAYNIDNTNLEVIHFLSETYRSLNDWEKSLFFAWKFMKNNQDNSNTPHLNFGYLLYECYAEKSKDLAYKYASKWLKFYPDNVISKHMGNAILNNQKLQTSDTEFITETFNAFAPDFDETLADLDYQAPHLIYNALCKNLKYSIFSKYKILDLGCGTGLCGEKIKKFASLNGLWGVDLSENMLAKAKEKNIYNHLYCEDICQYLENNTKLFDVITASDVWTYFGDLAKAFVRVSRSLTSKGLFVFTISENNQNDEDYFLTPSGRFIHSLSYVEKVLKNSGLRINSTEKHILRNEAEIPVYGYIIVAQKPNISNT